MNNYVHSAFDKIVAEDELKQKTYSFLCAEIEKRTAHTRHPAAKFAVVFASLALVILIGTIGAKTYFTPMAYIDIDINPSVGIAINRFGIVVSADGYNNDGVNLLNGININNKNYQNSLAVLLEKTITDGYQQNNNHV
jgi:hypothetical protein